MKRADLNDLNAFLAVVREGSFTRAAAILGISQPSLSQTIRSLEARMGRKLFTRTTRSVAPTDAGARLARSIGPDIAHIEAELDALSALRDRPTGTVRITLGEHAARSVIWPKLPEFARAHPDIRIELSVDQGLSDIVADGFDAGIRFGDGLARDMIAVRVGPDLRMIVVGSPDYFRTHSMPLTPRDLTEHDCINLRMRTMGGMFVWDFERDGTRQNVRVEGQLVFSNNSHVVTPSLAGLGLGYIMEDVALPHLQSGELIQVLDEWSPTFDGYHLFYPTRRQDSPAFAAFVKAFRHRGD